MATVIVAEPGLIPEPPPGARLLEAEPPRLYAEAAGAARRGHVVIGAYTGAYQDAARARSIIEAESGNPLLYHPLSAHSLRRLPPGERGPLAMALAAAVAACKPWLAAPLPDPGKPATRRALLAAPLLAPLRHHPAPVVDEAACARARACRLCLEACPSRALRGKPPRVDPAACTLCGDCTRACPIAAITLPGWCPRLAPVLASRAPRPLSLIVAAEGHAAGLDEAAARLEPPALALLARSPSWITERLLLEAARSGIQVYIYEETLPHAPPGPRRLAQSALIGVAGPKGPLHDPHPAPEGYKPLEPIAGTLEVDESKCTLCGACTRACPTGALTLTLQGDTYTLTLDEARCTGCQLCAGACPEHAIRAETIYPPRAGTRTLASSPAARCRSCGAPIAPQASLHRTLERLRAKGLPATHLYLCRTCRLLHAYKI